MDLITRQFRVKRGDREIIYPFTTYSDIFSETQNELHQKLFDYLKKVFIEGVPDLSGKKSISQLPALITPEFKSTKKHEIIKLAKESNYEGMRNKQHDILQNYFLKNDPLTLAIEIPVWGDEESGHIDLIRLNEKVEIWDFKPNAHKEKKAGSQVWRYREKLCNATGIKLSDTLIGYFDNNTAYIF